MATTSEPRQRELYWISGSPFAWRAMLALEAKGLPYTSRQLQASKGEHKAPAYIALNPRGKVPTLKDGDLVVYESLAIMTYLDRAYPKPPLFGGDGRETARIWRSVSEVASYLEAPVTRIVRPIFFSKIAEHGDDIRAAAAEVHGELARLEGSLGDGQWLAGPGYSAADIAAYPFIKGLLRAAGKAEAAPLALGFLPFEARYPKLAKWMARVEALPGFERTYPPHWR